jgi:hypothetical protein
MCRRGAHGNLYDGLVVTVYRSLRAEGGDWRQIAECALDAAADMEGHVHSIAGGPYRDEGGANRSNPNPRAAHDNPDWRSTVPRGRITPEPLSGASA